MNGNGELTETMNVIFYVSYGVLTEFLWVNVILTYFDTATATVTVTDTERWKSGMRLITRLFVPLTIRTRSMVRTVHGTNGLHMLNILCVTCFLT